ncbi:SRPBCC domain-containing protein [Streptosporangium canum]|uniref:SRPBCC family protein n=1 Tax=Streptosporangium canum TaxID=324952 RepID=UPI003438AAA0
MKTAEHEIVRDFAARREQVYAAWTRPERFARWFGTRVFTTPADRVVPDVRLAGHLAVQATSSKVSARP